MTDHRFPDFPNAPDGALPRPRPFITRGLLLAGVAAAGLLGAGLGLWARPAMSERRMAVAAPPAELSRAPQRRLEIVVDNAPAPIGAPIEVLPQPSLEPLRVIEHQSEPPGPVQPSPGLLRVVAPAPAPVQTPAVAAKPVVRPPLAAPKPRAIQMARAQPASRKAEPARTKARDVQLAKAKPNRRTAEVQVAKAKSQRRAPVELAQAPAKRAAKLTRLLVRLAPHKARTEPEAHIEKAKYDRHGKSAPHKALVPRPEAPRKSASAKAEKVAAHKLSPAPRHQAAAPPLRPAGLMKVSNHTRCGQSDPGAKLVCADAALGAADRQMSRAYRDARAAGVSDDQLQHQQQRWLAARAAAAREAPWAVHDVYLARIAQLNGMAHEAHDGN